MADSAWRRNLLYYASRKVGIDPNKPKVSMMIARIVDLDDIDKVETEARVRRYVRHFCRLFLSAEHKREIFMQAIDTYDAS